MTVESSDVHAMVRVLRPGDMHRIEFQVGKFGRTDRFVLYRRREEVMELVCWSQEETEAVLKILDDLVDTDPDFGILYNNAREFRFAYCHWCKPIGMDGKRFAQSTLPKILPLYQRRMEEQKRLVEGSLKRGHREFGFFPLDGYR